MSVPAGFMQGLLQGYQFADNTALRRRQEQRQAKLDEEARKQREFTNQATTQQLGFQQDRLNILKDQASRQDQTFQQQQEDRARQEELRQINAALAKAQAGRPDLISDQELQLLNQAYPGGVHRWDASALKDIQTLEQVVQGNAEINDPSVIQSLNRMWADRIKRNVGTPGRYGAPIADVNVRHVVTLPGGRLGFRLEVVDTNGRKWYPPMTENRSADPGDPVLQADVKELIRDLKGRAALAKAAMSQEMQLIKAEAARRGGSTTAQKPIILPQGAVAINQTGGVLASNPSAKLPPQTIEQIKTLRAREVELRRNLGNVFNPGQRAPIENELARVVDEINRLVGLGGGEPAPAGEASGGVGLGLQQPAETPAPAQPAAAQGDLRPTIVNKQTGQVMQLINGRWVPATL